LGHRRPGREGRSCTDGARTNLGEDRGRPMGRMRSGRQWPAIPPIRKNGKVWGNGITQNVNWHVVEACTARAGITSLAPHDLRRTCARLCHVAGGELEQIQFLLGHASVQTTEGYIGCKQDLTRAVNDRLPFAVTRPGICRRTSLLKGIYRQQTSSLVGRAVSAILPVATTPHSGNHSGQVRCDSLTRPWRSRTRFWQGSDSRLGVRVAVRSSLRGYNVSG
jgi:hypothetical protein